MLAATEENGQTSSAPSKQVVSPWHVAKGGGYWSIEDVRKLVEALNKHGYGRWAEMTDDPDLGLGSAGRTLDGIEAKIRRLKKKGFLERTTFRKGEPENWRLREDLLLQTLQYNFDRMNPKLRGSLPPPPVVPPTLQPPEPLPKVSKRKRKDVLGGILNSEPLTSVKRAGGWTMTELASLLDGVNRYGVGNWTAIFGDSQSPWRSNGRRIDDLRVKFLQMKSQKGFTLVDSKWQLALEAIIIDEAEPRPTNEATTVPTKRVKKQEGTEKTILQSAGRVLPGGRLKRQHVPWNEDEVGALVEGLNRYGEGGVRDMIKDMTLPFNPKRRTVYIVQTKLSTLFRHNIISHDEGTGCWKVDLNLFHLITKRRKGLPNTDSNSKSGCESSEEDQ